MPTWRVIETIFTPDSRLNGPKIQIIDWGTTDYPLEVVVMLLGGRLLPVPATIPGVHSSPAWTIFLEVEGRTIRQIFLEEVSKPVAETANV